MNIKIRRTLLFGTLALLVCASNVVVSIGPTYAGVRYEGKSDVGLGGTIRVTIYGTISKADAEYFTHHAVEYENDDLSVSLDSLGGDVDAAIQIGRIIRKNEATVSVPKGSKCYSSCALIYIAAVRRFNFGTIGLHRPYFASAPQSRQSLEREAPRMLQQLKVYVQEMGITDNFYQEMVNTEPTSIKLYDGDDIKNLVPKLDPTFDEIETSYDARKYGTNTAEMRIRERDRDSCDVNGPVNLFFCIFAAEWGLSNAVWEYRSKNTSQCELSDEEKRALKLVKRKERHDHPLYLKHEACERNIMLGR